MVEMCFLLTILICKINENIEKRKQKDKKLCFSGVKYEQASN